jgi:hypothetical protein
LAVACGGSDEPPPAAASGPAQATTPAGAPEGQTTTRLVLSGHYTFDGPFTGYLTCYHDTTRYFYLEGQQPYYLSIVVNEVEDGTFEMPEQDPANGFMKRKEGEPQLDVRGLRKVDGSSENPAFRNLGGSITFVDEGTSGSLTADWVSDQTGEKVHSELTWEGCPAT